MTESCSGKRYVIAGGSGFLGVSLAEYLVSLGASVTVLTRRPQPARPGVEAVRWDARSSGSWYQVLDRADGLVNLAGRSVNCIKTPDHQDEILRSRVESTRALGAALRGLNSPPPVWVQMSTAHLYGDPPELVCEEDAPPGYGLAPTVAKAWEAALDESLLPEQRAVVLRTGFVIGRDRGAGSGALGTLGWLARWGLGGRVGSGKQGMSWIHELDMNRLFVRGLTDSQMRGAYIASGQNPVSQVEFMRQLRKAMGMPLGMPAFEWMVRIAAPLLLRTDPELALYGRYVRSRRLAEEGFEFRFPQLAAALAEIYSKNGVA
ncbi:MAG: epimerase [Planctomycetota bacterium]